MSWVAGRCASALGSIYHRYIYAWRASFCHGRDFVSSVGGGESSFCSPNQHAHEKPPLSSKSVARVGRICTGLYESARRPANLPSSDSFACQCKNSIQVELQFVSHILCFCRVFSSTANASRARIYAYLSIKSYQIQNEVRQDSSRQHHPGVAFLLGRLQGHEEGAQGHQQRWRL